MSFHIFIVHHDDHHVSPIQKNIPFVRVKLQFCMFGLIHRKQRHWAAKTLSQCFISKSGRRCCAKPLAGDLSALIDPLDQTQQYCVAQSCKRGKKIVHPDQIPEILKGIEVCCLSTKKVTAKHLWEKWKWVNQDLKEGRNHHWASPACSGGAAWTLPVTKLADSYQAVERSSSGNVTHITPQQMWGWKGFCDIHHNASYERALCDICVPSSG